MNQRADMSKRWILRAAAGILWAAAAGAAPIRDIQVVPVGDEPLNAEQVLAQVSVRVGQELDRAALSEDIRALQRSGAFSYAEVRLETAADGIDGIIDKLYDVKHIDTDMCVREHLLGDGNKAVVHIATEVLDALALNGGILAEVILQVFSGDSG